MNESAMEEHIKDVRDRMARLERGHEEMRIAIGGGDLTGKPGLLQNQVRMISALFDEKEGLVPRLTSMERRELERMGFIKGAYFAWCGVGVVIGWLVNHFFK